MVENERNRRATEQTQPPPARPRRTPFPPNLPREDNPISVPDAERPCPKCGLERRCAGHDVSEVLELVPARVIVRRDLREKLACDACDAPNFSRAPVGDRVVQGASTDPVSSLNCSSTSTATASSPPAAGTISTDECRPLGLDAGGPGCVRRRAPAAALARSPDRGTQSECPASRRHVPRVLQWRGQGCEASQEAGRAVGLRR